MNERSIFLSALEKADPALRAAYLDEACAGDEALRRAVDRLLHAHIPQDSFLEKPPPDLAPTREEESKTSGMVLGPYKLREKIGEGGMGEVWVADQEKPIRRRVALKVIKPGMDSKQVIARFEAERQALALMDHPNIAKVLDAGTTPGEAGGISAGRPYFVMELVKGVPITDFCDARKLTPQERLALFVPVCQAVQHAHQKGIIHRDLKPSNILVALHDERPVPKVIDFGVAKAVGQQLTEKTVYTGFGALVGTPAYMAPEQATFNQLDVDTRADVYALGVLLYELLAGSPPFEPERLRKAAFDEMLRVVREEEPPRPSARLSTSQARATIAAVRQSDPDRLAKLVRGELDWIVMKALDKDRTRRYDTAAGLAKDVERYLKDEPVEACPPSLLYRLGKAYRKNRALATMLMAAFALLSLTVGAVLFALLEAQRQRDAADAARADEARQREAALSERDDKERAWNAAVKAQGDMRAAQYLWDMQMIPIAWKDGNVGQTLGLLNRHRPAPGQTDLRDFEWHYWDRHCHAERRSVKLNPAIAQPWFNMTNASHSAFSPDGSRFATIDVPEPENRRSEGPRRETVLKVWDVASGKQLLAHALTLSKNTPLWSGGVARNDVLFSRDGTRIAVGWNCQAEREPGADNLRKLIRVLEVKSGKVLLDHPVRNEMASRLNLSPDGRRLVGYFARGERRHNEKRIIRVWDVDSGKELFTVDGWGSDMLAVPFSPDSRRIAGIAPGKEAGKHLVKVWDATTGKELASWTIHHTPAHATLSAPPLVFSPDNVSLAGILTEGARSQAMATLKVWNAASGKEQHSFPIPLRRGPYGFRPFFSPDGTRLAVSVYSLGLDRLEHEPEVAVWNMVTGRQWAIVPVGKADVSSFSPDGEYLVAVRKNVLTLWGFPPQGGTDSARPRVAFTLRGHLDSISAYAFAVNGRRLVTVDTAGILKEWDVRGEEPIVHSARAGLQRRAFVLDPNAGQLACIQRLGEGANSGIAGVVVCDAWTGQGEFLLTPRVRPVVDRVFQLWRVAFSNDGRRIALARCLQLSREEYEATRPSDLVADITVWDTATRQEVAYLDLPRFHIASGYLAFAPDLSRVAVSRRVVGEEGASELKVFAIATGKEEWTTPVSSEVVSRLVFSADGRRLAGILRGAGRRGRRVPGKDVTPQLTIWDARNGTALAATDVAGPDPNVVWSPNGEQLTVWREWPGNELFGVYDAARGSKRFSVEQPTGAARDEGTRLTAVTFSPNGRRIVGYVQKNARAVGRGGPPVKVWDAGTGKELLALSTPHGGWMTQWIDLQFTRDGHRLVLSRSGMTNGEVAICTFDATPRKEPPQP